jgi:soluble lytic murein transglycosylase-like protein
MKHLTNATRFIICAVITSALSLQSVFANGDRSTQISDSELKAFLQSSVGQATLPLDKYEAEVWLESMLSKMQDYRVDQQEALKILHAVYRQASTTDIPPDLVLAVIAIESSFNRFAVSRVGAQGLMQVMPFWKKEIGRDDDSLTHIETNIRYGCAILQYYWKKSDGNIDEALARYNGSYGRNTYSNKVISNWRNNWLAGRINPNLATY